MHSFWPQHLPACIVGFWPPTYRPLLCCIAASFATQPSPLVAFAASCLHPLSPLLSTAALGHSISGLWCCMALLGAPHPQALGTLPCLSLTCLMQPKLLYFLSMQLYPWQPVLRPLLGWLRYIYLPPSRVLPQQAKWANSHTPLFADLSDL